MNDISSTQSIKAHRGILILILGLVGMVCCPFIGIIAWVMGNSDMKAMAAGTMDRNGEGMTKVGKIFGIVGCVIAIMFMIKAVFFGGLAGISGVHPR